MNLVYVIQGATYLLSVVYNYLAQVEYSHPQASPSEVDEGRRSLHGYKYVFYAKSINRIYTTVLANVVQ